MPKAKQREKILNEHREILDVVASVQSLLSGPAEELCAELEELTLLLRPHFLSETESFLFRELPTEQPRFAERLARLEAEHTKFLETLEQTCHGLGRSGSAEVASDHRARIESFLARLNRHEAEEREILMSAMYDDIGTNG
ncbi:MAG: hemerythrin domain-containing protein [Deltaproteobacteria bacterium]|nr:hemerythrin domain-containing protein [Deltaproteobacteria bacterium]